MQSSGHRTFTPAVMVYLDKADNVNLLGLTDEPLQAELVECDSAVSYTHLGRYKGWRYLAGYRRYFLSNGG